MRALVLEAPRRLALRDVAEPPVGDHCLVAVERVGICGTDVAILNGSIPVTHPRVLGHEVVGRVVRAGRYGAVAEGTRVLVDPAVSCGRCLLCRRDRANLCTQGALMGRDVDGGFAEYVAVDERQLLPIPDSIPPADAGLLQVLGVCVHAQERVSVRPTQTAVVLGLGAGGLLHVQLLVARGVQAVVGVTRSPEKRALAKVLGASVTCGPEDAAACVSDLTDGRGADLVVEAAGAMASLAQAIDLAGPGATILLYGVLTASEGALPFHDLYFKELDVVSSRAALARDYATAIDLVGAGRVSVARLLTGAYPLEHAAEAFSALERPGVVKLVLEVTQGPASLTPT